MRTLWPQLSTWLDSGEPFALATVIAVSGSVSRAPGSCMAIMPERNRFLGSVSSGCLDTEVVHAADAALTTGESQRLRFGPDGSPPWIAGLTCGGWVDVLVDPWWGSHPRERVRPVASRVRSWLEDDRPGVVLTRDGSHLAIDDDDEPAGDIEAFSREWIDRARAQLAAGMPPALCGTAQGSVFIRTVRRRPRLFLLDAVDIAARLVAFGREAGFSTFVVDPRSAHGVAERFSVAPDHLVRSWPQKVIAGADLGPRDAAIVLTHDPKIDDAALLALLKTAVGYLGALGSKRSHAERLERLEEAGADRATLDRIQGPAGIHLGTPDAAGIAAGIFAGLLQWQAGAERTRLQSVVGVGTGIGAL